jgi:putative endonuclease
MASVYILYSQRGGKYYIGCTNDIDQRIHYHTSKEFVNSFTAKYSEWELFYEIPSLSITTARKIEAHIKRMKSTVYLRNLKKFPEMTQRLILKYG